MVYAQIHGAFDYNKTPLIPPGTNILVHKTPTTWKSWTLHGGEGWYVGPAIEHYLCFRYYIQTTGSKRIAETVEFSPKHVKVLSTTSKDAEISTVHDLIYELKNPTSFSPTLQLGD